MSNMNNMNININNNENTTPNRINKNDRFAKLSEKITKIQVNEILFYFLFLFLLEC
jgi:hypothetical protein